ncbi:MAG: hypothetical protein M1383_05910 [Patescibacteria group bacterium]|nr:hypothetical protein [Patescibacteria group bacterium]
MSPESAHGGRLYAGRKNRCPVSNGARRKRLRQKQPIVTTFRQCPEVIRTCIQFLFGQARTHSCSKRSQIVRDVDYLLKHRQVDISAFEERGFRPVKVYVQRRLIRMRFLRQDSERPYIVKMFPNDYRLVTA